MTFDGQDRCVAAVVAAAEVDCKIDPIIRELGENEDAVLVVHGDEALAFEGDKRYSWNGFPVANALEMKELDDNYSILEITEEIATLEVPRSDESDWLKPVAMTES